MILENSGDGFQNVMHVGNRFWNCHYGISGTNVYKFNSEYNIFRSTQSTASLPGLNFLPQGQSAIGIASNRFQYLVRYNEFTNISQCINFPLASGAYSTVASGTATGIYASLIGIVQNVFSPGTGTGNYIRSAVNISCVNAFTPVVITNTNVSPPASGIIIENNNFNDVYRAINVNGITGLHNEIRSNTIRLVTDNVISSTQYGIKVTNGISATSSGFYTTVHGNNATGAGTTTPNAGEALFFLSMNKGINSPSVACNDAQLAHSAFVFDSDNSDAVWAGNVMKPMIRGLVLTNTAEVGPQGDINTSSYNTWAGTWQANTHYGTYAVTGSTAGLSPLWCANQNMFPQNNSGDPLWNSQFWYHQSNNNVLSSAGGDYNCIGIPNNISIPIPEYDKYDNATAFSIYQNLLYRTVQLDPGLNDPHRELESFHASLSTSTARDFMDVEQNLYEGEYNSARSINNDIELDEDNNCEVTYQEFYRIYANYQEGVADNSAFSGEDSLALLELALLCPGANGPAVYQARALYNYIYRVSIEYAGCHDESFSERRAGSAAETDHNPKSDGEIRVFPNPAQDLITFQSTRPNNQIEVKISDISGRTVLEEKVNLYSGAANLHFELKNGLYFVNISSEGHEKSVKKIVVQR